MSQRKLKCITFDHKIKQVRGLLGWNQEIWHMLNIKISALHIRRLETFGQLSETCLLWLQMPGHIGKRHSISMDVHKIHLSNCCQTNYTNKPVTVQIAFPIHRVTCYLETSPSSCNSCTQNSKHIVSDIPQNKFG